MRPDDKLTRREFLAAPAGCLGPLALADLLAADAPAADPLAGKRPHHRPRANAVICLFQHGGPSQIDLFDPKPELSKRHGQSYPGEVEAHFSDEVGKLLASPFTFKKVGRSGLDMSNLLPRTAGIADEITLVRSMTTEAVDHELALRILHGGKSFPGRPVWGSWVLYGLGSRRRDLPAYVVLGDPGGLPIDGANEWSAGFLPASYQATPFRARGAPVAHLRSPVNLPAGARQNQLAFLGELNRIHGQQYAPDPELDARTRDNELAAQMQLAVPALVDISRETEETRRLYGLDNPACAEYGGRCLLARRLVEQGVRFIQIYLRGYAWDTHARNAEQLRTLCARTDQPAAALVTDLKRRGLLDSTLVLWTGEFGRLPVAQGTDGRDHNRQAFSLWLAGGGFKKGYAHGATDEFSYRAVKDVVRVCDLHATLLHALGLDHRRLTFPHEGRNDSLTDADVTKARVVPELLD